MYYLESGSSSEDLIIKLVNELLKSVYNETTFYCHNFGRYGSVYIKNALYKHNDKCDKQEINDSKYNKTYIFRDKDIIKIRTSKEVDTIIKRKTKNNDIDIIKGKRIAKLVVCDSMALLNNSLQDLAKSYQVKTQKGIFPYKFASRSNLFYVGNTPDKSYFKSSVNQSHYN